MKYRTGIGQDSHRFDEGDHEKKCVIAGVVFEGVPPFKANSDGDVVFHALCNAISTLTSVTILGDVADELCKKGITDSEEYLNEAIKSLDRQEIVHIAISLEGLRPKFLPRYTDMKDNIARVAGISPRQVGIMATTGEGLTAFGKGEGVFCTCIVTTSEPQ